VTQNTGHAGWTIATAVATVICSAVSSQAIRAQEVGDDAAKERPDAPHEATKAESIQELVVTGTYIRRSSFEDVGSPVDVLDAESIARDGPGGKATDFLRYMPQNVGSFGTRDDANAQDVSFFGGGTVNLRGLGASSTLVLMNGHRHVRFPLSPDGAINVNSLLPTIAVARVEVLKDGASGIYGTDAIAGVVNFISRDDFEGLEFRTDARGDTAGWNFSQYTAGVIAGGRALERVHLVGSLEYAQASDLTRGDLRLPRQDIAGTTTSGFGFPGNFTVPLRDANGNPSGSSVTVADPNCARAINDGITTNPANAGTDSWLFGGRCRLSFKNEAFVFPEHSWIGRAAATVDLGDTLKFKASFGAAENTTDAKRHASTPILATPIVPGENPGNTFRAVNSLGQPLFALPDPANPSEPLRNANGTVVLTATPTDPSSGIAFNEDVRATFRPYSTTNSGYVSARNELLTTRADAGFTGTLRRDWFWELSTTYAEQEATLRLQDVILNKLLDGFACRLGPARNQCYNPFGNSLYASPGTVQYNDPLLEDEITVVLRDVYTSTIWSIDGVLSGEFGSLPAGPIGVAVGAQRRHEELDQDFDGLKTSSLVAFWGNGDRDFDVGDTTQALFLETRVPILGGDLGDLELSAAGRYERQEASGLHSFDPKFSLLYKKNGVRLRGSYATSFLAPSLFQRFGSLSSFASVDDSRGSGIAADQVNTRIVGSSQLKPQESRSYNLGLAVGPSRGLRASVDYWRTDYEDLLTTLTAQAIINADPLGPLIERDPATGRITLLRRPYFNASSIETSGVDLQLDYSFQTNRLGAVTLFSAVTWLAKYDIRVNASSATFDGVGTDNSPNFGNVMPEWRANAGVSWTAGRHTASLIGRYFSEVKRPNTVYFAESDTVFDAQYTCELASSRLKLSAGVINLFDNRPNTLSGTAAGGLGNGWYLATVQDPVPRRVYLTASYSLQ
jgi:iron complex outermembrane receptor protein